jgi:hypothetical protein
LRVKIDSLVKAAVAAALACSGMAEAATVKSVQAKKKTVTIEMDEGEKLEVDANICFYTDSDKKLECGTLAKVKGTLGLVKVEATAKRLKRIKPGMSAKAEEGGVEESEAAAAEGEAAAADAKTKGKGKGKKGAKGAAAAAKSAPFRIWGVFTPGLASPMTYNKVVYAAPTSEAPETLWSDDGAVKSTLYGFGLGFGIPIGSMSLNPGFRFRSFVPSVIDADYVVGQENPYVSTEQKASALGVWIDFQYLRSPLTPSFILNATAGLDIDQSTVTVKTTKKDDRGGDVGDGTIADATSKLMVISLRAGAGFDFMFVKNFGAHFGLNLLIPLSASQSFSAKIPDEEARGQADPAKDLQDALGHKKNSFGFDVTTGLVLAI